MGKTIVSIVNCCTIELILVAKFYKLLTSYKLLLDNSNNRSLIKKRRKKEIYRDKSYRLHEILLNNCTQIVEKFKSISAKTLEIEIRSGNTKENCHSLHNFITKVGTITQLFPLLSLGCIILILLKSVEYT